MKEYIDIAQAYVTWQKEFLLPHKDHLKGGGEETT